MTLRKQGLDILLKVNRTRHYVLSIVAMAEGLPSANKGPPSSDPYFEWAFTMKRPSLPDGGLHLPHSVDGLYRFEPPNTFSACKAVTLVDAMDGRLSDPGAVIMKLQVNWGHASAQQPGNMHLANDMHSSDSAGEVSGKCDARRP